MDLGMYFLEMSCGKSSVILKLTPQIQCSVNRQTHIVIIILTSGQGQIFE